MSVRVSTADLRRLQAEGKRVAFPKPAKRGPKPRKPIKRGPAPRRSKRPTAISDAVRARIKAWPDFKRRVFAAHSGLCYWCGKPCPLEEGTVEHIIPFAKTHSDRETLVAWIHHRGFPMSCHGAKSSAGFQGQVAGLRWNARLYGVPFREATGPEKSADGRVEWNDPAAIPLRERLRAERDLLWGLLNVVQRDIDAGKRPSLLTPKPAGE